MLADNPKSHQAGLRNVGSTTRAATFSDSWRHSTTNDLGYFGARRHAPNAREWAN